MTVKAAIGTQISITNYLNQNSQSLGLIKMKGEIFT